MRSDDSHSEYRNGRRRMNYLIFLILAVLTIAIESTKYNFNQESEFVKLFSKCFKSDPGFDVCVKNGLNRARPYFKYGVPEFDVPPFDPFFAKEVIQSRGGPNFNYKLTLRNVYERGWTNSNVYRFKSNLKKGYIQYYQWFPAKFLDGDWEIESYFGSTYANSGTFQLSLYNYTQVTTIYSEPGFFRDSYAPLHVRIEAIDSGDMEIHVNNLVKGASPSVDWFLDRVINFGWRPGFVLLKPLINDLVSKAFTKIFNDSFRNFPFEKIFRYSRG